jgi:hypothetical protein
MSLEEQDLSLRTLVRTLELLKVRLVELEVVLRAA